MFKVTFLPNPEESFKRLETRIAQKIDWLSENADKIIHHPFVNLPDDLRGLCSIGAGDYPIIYWAYTEREHIKIYEIEHRSKNYCSVKK